MTKPARGATMWQKGVSLFLCYLLLFACGGVAGEEPGAWEYWRDKDRECYRIPGLETQACL